MKKPFVTAEQLEDIAVRYPTPFHLYDAQGIRENARRLKAAFSWNPGYREYFAVKATPTPAILKILQEEGCGCDCSSLTELMMAERIGCTGENIMFSSNETPAEDYRLAAKLGATINLDDVTHVDFLEKTIGYIPKRIGCRFNPGGTFSLGESREGFQVMDNPGDAKYGMTRPQIAQAFTRPEYFWPRPSAVDYAANATGGSNLSPAGEALRERALESLKSLEATPRRKAPADLVTASGSGMDPHITLKAAHWQAERVARARGLELPDVLELANSLAETPGGVLNSAPLVNVLKLNMALDLMGSADAKAMPAPGEVGR